MTLDASDPDVDLPLPPDPDPQRVRFPALKIAQPIGDIYVGAVPFDALIRITFFDVRRISKTERELENYLGIQRPLDPKRVRSLESFVNFADASFPSSIIISVPSDYALYDEEAREIELRNFREGDEQPSRALRDVARVIDGQHRIAGLEAFTGATFDLSVTIFIGADISDQAYVFSTVNLEQTKVSKSLAYDLFSLARTRSPQKTCHNIAIALDRDRNSPFFDKIKRLGLARREARFETITQATFVEMLLALISPFPKQDRDDLLRGRRLRSPQGIRPERYVFRELFVSERDLEIGRNVDNYFKAVSDRWPEAWRFEGGGIMLGRTNGFRALMRLLPFMYLYLKRGASEPVIETARYLKLFEGVNVADTDFTTETYPPGSTGESKLFNALMDAMPFLREALRLL